MKKHLFLIVCMVLGVSVMAQQKIQLRSADKAECVKSDMTSLRASFSFSTIEAENVETQRGEFSLLSMPNTVIGGNEGDPQIPVINEVIAVPLGAQPTITVTSYSTKEYNLNDLGIKTLIPRQPSLKKNQNPDDVPFVYNEAAYNTRGFRSEPRAIVEVVGTMRGVRLGKMTIEPVSYDPVNNTLRVFNDIEVEVSFDGADATATEDLLVKTYSPYFNIVYKQLFNDRALRDAYSAHPDLYATPVKMLVVATQDYQNSTAFQNWLAWKKQKGINVDIYTVTSSTASSTIQSGIYSRYNTNHPTFLVIVGDETVVKAYKTDWSCGSTYGDCINDLEYASVDGDVYHDMFMSRMAVSSTTELNNLVNKILTYEKYTMSDPSYLSKVLLIAGNDSGSWDDNVGRPTIQYALNNYYNTAHGFSNIYSYTTSTYTGCYDYLSSGVGFANYTAHGDINALSNPSFTVSNVSSLTNNDKYFWLVANCCLSANWGNSSISPCLGEALIRAENKGAFGYIGSIPESYWYEDYYFGVGAFSYVAATVQTTSSTTTGMYDAIFDDSAFNTLNSVPYIGNVAVTYAHAAGYQSSVSDEYYWRAYQCLGDGSVMPYTVAPSANNVDHANTITIGASSFQVSADNGSYVAITKNNEILGAAEVISGNSVNVPISGLTSAGDVMVVVTRQQRQPYITTIQAISTDGPYISLDSYTPNTAHVGENTNLSITFKNVGTDATSGTTKVTLTPNDSYVNVIQGVKTFGALAANATITLSDFQFSIASGVADETPISLHYKAENGNDIWEGDLNITAAEAVLKFQEMVWDGSFVPGQTLTIGAKFKNEGHYQATNANITLTTSSNYLTINTETVSAGTLEVGQTATYNFSVTISANCPETEQIPVIFTMDADGGLSATGNGVLKNSCMLHFELADSYGDGWNGSYLTVSFDDGTESQTLTISSGSSASYEMEVGNGVHVTLTWTSGSQWDKECSFTVSYDDNVMIYELQTNVSPSSGVLIEFDCNCAAETQTYTVTATSSNTNQGTVSGGGEFNYGESCTVTATPAEGYMFTSWTMNGEIISTAAQYTFNVISDMNLVANFEEGLMIGDGGSTTNENLPSHSYYNYTLSEQIYTTAELGGEGLITGISFFNGGSTKTRKLDIYMKSTTKSTFSGETDWISVSDGDRVFSGDVSMTADEWTMITFTSPFVYDGASNVVLVTDDNTGSYSSGMKCRVFDASSQAIYVRSDGTNYNPTSPSSYSGTVLSVKNQLLITKEALPTGTFNITVSVSPEQAATVTGGGEYDFGQTVNVVATPNAGYTFTGWTENGNVVASELSYSFAATADRNLVANFIQAIEIGEGTATNNFLPTYNYYNYSMTEQIYTADEIGMAGTINCIAFYNEGTEKTRTLDFYLKVTDKESFSSKTDWVTVNDSDKVFSGEVTMAVNAWTFIYFTTPYEYDGVSNLVLVADDNSGAYTSSPHMACSVYDANGTQSIYIYSDNTNYDPSSPTTDQTSNYAALSVKNHILMGITASSAYVITATANPTYGGTVNGGGTFEEGETCTLTATANTGYRFTNWTMNGNEVSTDATYTFDVTASGIYVANFTAIPQYTITIKPNDVEKGTVAFGSKDEVTNEHHYDFEDGWQGWTAFKGTEGTSPHNWMHNTEYSAYDSNGNLIVPECHDSSEGMMLSESYISASTEGGSDATAVYPDNYLVSPQFKLGGSFTFYAAARMSNYPAEHFSVLVSETGNSDVSDFIHNELTVTLEDNTWYEYTIDLSAYSGMGYVAIRHYDCYDQHLLYVDDVTIMEPEESDGSVSATFYEGETCTIVATPSEGYNLATWTEGDAVVSANASYSFTVGSDRELVANFVSGSVQIIDLVAGWNWISVDIIVDDPVAMLDMLKAALGDNGLQIKSMDDYTTYEDGEWGAMGDLEEMYNEQMYAIEVSADCTVTLQGTLATPDDYTIEINPGWNWIGFPCSQVVSLEDALANFDAEDGDQIKGAEEFSTFEDGEWGAMGDLEELVPGQGYKYFSASTEVKELIFSAGTKSYRKK